MCKGCPPGSAGVSPASLFLQTATHPRHSLAMRTETAFTGISSVEAGADRKRAVHGLTPTATCCRRLRGSTLALCCPWAYAHGYLLPPPSRLQSMPPGSAGVSPASLFLQTATHPRHSLAMRTETAFTGISSVEAGADRKRAVAAFAARLLRSAVHGLTPTATCCRRLRGSNRCPPGARASRPHPYSCKQPPIHATPLQCAPKPPLGGSLPLRLEPIGNVLSPPSRLDSCALLSMGLRPRLPAAAAFAAPIDAHPGARASRPHPYSCNGTHRHPMDQSHRCTGYTGFGFRSPSPCNPEHLQPRTGSSPTPVFGARTFRPLNPVHPVHPCSKI